MDNKIHVLIVLYAYTRISGSLQMFISVDSAPTNHRIYCKNHKNLRRKYEYNRELVNHQQFHGKNIVLHTGSGYLVFFGCHILFICSSSAILHAWNLGACISFLFAFPVIRIRPSLCHQFGSSINYCVFIGRLICTF